MTAAKTPNSFNPVHYHSLKYAQDRLNAVRQMSSTLCNNLSSSNPQTAASVLFQSQNMGVGKSSAPQIIPT